MATSLNGLAETYRAQGRYTEAEPLYKRSLAIREKVLDPAHPDLIQSLNNLAGLYLDQGRTADAEPLLKSVARAHGSEIFDAARRGDVEEVKRLLQARPGLVNVETEDGWAPLHLAAYEGHKAIVELLLAHGAEVDPRDSRGWTLLNLVAAKGDKEIADVLLAHGADMHALSPCQHPFLDRPAMTKAPVIQDRVQKCVKPRKSNVSGFPSPSLLRSSAA